MCKASCKVLGMNMRARGDGFAWTACMQCLENCMQSEELESYWLVIKTIIFLKHTQENSQWFELIR